MSLDKSFQKDIERDKLSGKYNETDFTLLKSLIVDLQDDKLISAHHKRHLLKGDLRGFECIHIKNDWLLIFKVDEFSLKLAMLGKHTQVYKKFK
ncbi:MAG: type II toxin-antitoxin system mRNA interferase toxin, RelE/StbE family [Sulfuricurvum sp.]